MVRVHPEYLERQHLPKAVVGKDIWDERFKSIRKFEQHLARNGVLILKFFLHVSKEEQRQRFIERLDHPDKNWKFSAADVLERQLFGDYMDAYEDMICHTATTDAPWHVVPADNKWFTRLVVAAVVVDALESIKPSFPKLDADKMRELAAAREALEAERGGKSKTVNKHK